MEIKDLLEQLDLNPELLAEGKTVEDFKAAFDSKYLAKDVAHVDQKIVDKVAGKIFGSLATKLHKIAGITFDEAKSKKPEEVIDMITSKYETEITALKETAGKGNDDKLIALTEEFEKTKKEALKYKELAQNLGTNLENTNKEWEGKFTGYKTENAFNKVKSEITYRDDIKEVEKIGFDTLLTKKYKFVLGEGDKFEVTDHEGNPIPNSKKTGFLTPKEAIESEAMAQGLRKNNNGEGGNGKAPIIVKHGQGNEGEANNGRKLNPAAAAHAQEMAK